MIIVNIPDEAFGRDSSGKRQDRLRKILEPLGAVLNVYADCGIGGFYSGNSKAMVMTDDEANEIESALHEFFEGR